MSYREQFFALQSPGQALPTDPDSVWGRLLDGLAREYGRTESWSSALVRESDPRQSAELLPDWERVCGLPGDCAIAWDSTLQARRAAVVAQLTGAGGQRAGGTPAGRCPPGRPGMPAAPLRPGPYATHHRIRGISHEICTPHRQEAQGEDAHYIDGNPELGILGSLVSAAAIEQGQRELLHVIKQAGLTPDEATLTQLYEAIIKIIGV